MATLDRHHHHQILHKCWNAITEARIFLGFKEDDACGTNKLYY
jgi:hypothetical protein